MKIAACQYCGLKKPELKTFDQVHRVECRCGAYSWFRPTKELAAKVWAEQQMKDDDE